MSRVVVNALVLALVASGCHGAFRQLPIRAGVTKVSRVEPALSRSVSGLVGRKVEVRCWSRRDWNTYVEDIPPAAEPELVGAAGEDVVDLSPPVCGPLVSLLYRSRPIRAGAAREQLAEAIGVLAHELEHVRGVSDEEEAECSGMQRLAATARALGLSRAQAGALAKLYWARIYRLNEEIYVSDECRNGGELDLRPGKSAWP